MQTKIDQSLISLINKLKNIEKKKTPTIFLGFTLQTTNNKTNDKSRTNQQTKIHIEKGKKLKSINQFERTKIPNLCYFNNQTTTNL